MLRDDCVIASDTAAAAEAVDAFLLDIFSMRSLYIEHFGG